MKIFLIALSFVLLNSVLCPPASGQAVTQLAVGHFHSLFQKSDGSLWGMGANSAGQLGDGTTNSSVTNIVACPERIISSNVVAIATGEEHSLFFGV